MLVPIPASLVVLPLELHAIPDGHRQEVAPHRQEEVGEQYNESSAKEQREAGRGSPFAAPAGKELALCPNMCDATAERCVKDSYEKSIENVTPPDDEAKR